MQDRRYRRAAVLFAGLLLIAACIAGTISYRRDLERRQQVSETMWLRRLQHIRATLVKNEARLDDAARREQSVYSAALRAGVQRKREALSAEPDVTKEAALAKSEVRGIEQLQDALESDDQLRQSQIDSLRSLYGADSVEPTRSAHARAMALYRQMLSAWHRGATDVSDSLQASLVGRDLGDDSEEENAYRESDRLDADLRRALDDEKAALDALARRLRGDIAKAKRDLAGAQP